MLSLAATAVTVFVAVSHIGFMVLETFLWATPKGRKIFRKSKEEAEMTKVLAANQGVYNGALAGAILWSVIAGDVAATMVLLIFVVVVGVYGAATAARNILFLQAAPAAVALVLPWLTL